MGEDACRMGVGGGAALGSVWRASQRREQVSVS